MEIEAFLADAGRRYDIRPERAVERVPHLVGTRGALAGQLIGLGLSWVQRHGDVATQVKAARVLSALSEQCSATGDI